MSDSVNDDPADRPGFGSDTPDEPDLVSQSADQSEGSEDQDAADWAAVENLAVTPEASEASEGYSSVDGQAISSQPGMRTVDPLDPLVMVETAFLASTSSLLWLVDYYFPMGPLLRIFFPVPIAMTYLRRGKRAAWMATLVCGLLLTVLMGPTRSTLFVMPYGLIGVLLGFLWSRGASWGMSIALGTIVGSFGFFFRIWLVSILLGDDLWLYITTQVTKIAEWAFLKLGLLTQPSLSVVQAIAFAMILLNNVIYLFVVHLAAKLVLERLRTPIPLPPKWVQVLLEEE